MSRNDAIGRYVMIFVCIYTAPAGQAACRFTHRDQSRQTELDAAPDHHELA